MGNRNGQMGDVLEITASTRIDRSAAQVRAQYRDIEHHIRHNVHPDIRYAWEPSEPGVRKIRTEFRLLGAMQYDVSLLVDEDDGSFVIDYLEGANAGTRLVHRFEPLGPTATNVVITALVPATTGRRILGPLFKAGVRRVLDKALREDKDDLESGRYLPALEAAE